MVRFIFHTAVLFTADLTKFTQGTRRHATPRRTQRLRLLHRDVSRASVHVGADNDNTAVAPAVPVRRGRAGRFEFGIEFATAGEQTCDAGRAVVVDVCASGVGGAA